MNEENQEAIIGFKELLREYAPDIDFEKEVIEFRKNIIGWTVCKYAAEQNMSKNELLKALLIVIYRIAPEFVEKHFYRSEKNQ
jgi:hypothetical protein